MKYFIDTEFLEGAQRTLFSKTKPTIDLISIGMVDENGREFYAISKEFNIKEAWNRLDEVTLVGEMPALNTTEKKYWIRENVLRPIFNELKQRYFDEISALDDQGALLGANNIWAFSRANLTWLINRYGHRNIEIANLICFFIYKDRGGSSGMGPLELAMGYTEGHADDPQFYGYFADYDWVVFCWLFGNMMNLPPSFPKYCRDLKQIFDEKFFLLEDEENPTTGKRFQNVSDKLSYVKQRADYPKQTGEHNALKDARWNKKLYEFLLSE